MISASKTTVPVFFDIVNDVENFYNIDTVKKEMQTAITYYRYTVGNKLIVNGTFKVTDEVADCRKLIEQPEKIFQLACTIFCQICQSMNIFFIMCYFCKQEE